MQEQIEDTVKGLRIILSNIDKPLHLIPENNNASCFGDEDSVEYDFDICDRMIEKLRCQTTWKVNMTVVKIQFRP